MAASSVSHRARWVVETPGPGQATVTPWRTAAERRAFQRRWAHLNAGAEAAATIAGASAADAAPDDDDACGVGLASSLIYAALTRSAGALLSVARRGHDAVNEQKDEGPPRGYRDGPFVLCQLETMPAPEPELPGVDQEIVCPGRAGKGTGFRQLITS